MPLNKETKPKPKKLRFISWIRFDFHMTDRLLIAVHAFASWCLGWWDTATKVEELLH